MLLLIMSSRQGLQIGKTIRFLRKTLFANMKEKEIDRNGLATALDISYNTITDWVKGRKYPRIDKIEMLADYFGIQKSDLIEDQEEDIIEDQEEDIVKGASAIRTFFGKKLKGLREGRELTQEDLAKALGISKSTVAMYETGKREPSFKMLEAIADYFNVRMGDLIQQAPENEADEVWQLREELAKKPELRILFSASKGATRADIEAAAQILETLKKRY